MGYHYRSSITILFQYKGAFVHRIIPNGIIHPMDDGICILYEFFMQGSQAILQTGNPFYNSMFTKHGRGMC